MSMTFALVTALQVPLPAAIPFALGVGPSDLKSGPGVVVVAAAAAALVGLPDPGAAAVSARRLVRRRSSRPVRAADLRRRISPGDGIGCPQRRLRQPVFSQLKNSSHDQAIAAERAGYVNCEATISTKGGVPVGSRKSTATVRSLQLRAGARTQGKSEPESCTSTSAARRRAWRLPGRPRADRSCGPRAVPAGRGPGQAGQEGNRRGRQPGQACQQHAAAKNLLFAQSSLPPATQALNADVRLQKAQTASFTRENASSAGLLFRLQALGKATARDATLNGARLLLLLFFIVIECLPIGVKVLLLLGPENAYERAFAKDERGKLRAAEHESRQQEHARILEADIARDEEARLLQERETRMDTVVRAAIDAEEEAALAAIREWKLGQLAAIADASYLQRQAAPSPGQNGTTLAGRPGPLVSPPMPDPGPGPDRAVPADPVTTAAMPGYDPVISGGALPGEDVAGNGAPPGSTIFPAASPPRQPLDTAPAGDQQPAGWFRVPLSDNAGPPWDFRGAEDTATRGENRPYGIGTVPGSAGTAGDAGPRGAGRPEAPPDSGQPE